MVVIFTSSHGFCLLCIVNDVAEVVVCWLFDGVSWRWRPPWSLGKWPRSCNRSVCVYGTEMYVATEFVCDANSFFCLAVSVISNTIIIGTTVVAERRYFRHHGRRLDVMRTLNPKLERLRVLCCTIIRFDQCTIDFEVSLFAVRRSLRVLGNSQ